MTVKHVTIQQESNIPIKEFMEVLYESGLGKRRPMDDTSLLEKMISGSNLLVTVRVDGKLIGLLRGLSDFCYRCFIADLAVVQDWQNQGIGRKMLQFTRELAPEARLILFSAEDAVGFYQKAGFHLHDRCYQLKPGDPLF